MATTITESQISSWDKNGKVKFVETCASNVGNSEALHALFYDLSKSMIEDKLTTDQLKDVIKDVMANDSIAQIPFISVLSILDIEYYGRNDHNRYIELVHACKSLLSHDLLRVELDYETQELAKIIVSKKATNQRYIRYKTKHYFKQHKYNLLREESEGFSKVARELDLMRPKNWESCIKNIETLSGRFALCPMRILDLILDVLEKRPQFHRIFAKFIGRYFVTIEKSSLNQVLGLRFSTVLQKEATGTDPKQSETLYRLTAFMISYELVDIDVIMGHMVPSLKDAQEEYKTYLAKSKEICDKLPSIPVLVNTDEIHLLPTIKMNQKLCVINELLKIGSFNHFFSLIEYLPENYVLSQPLVVNTYCKVLRHILQPLYIKHSGLPTAFTKRWRPPTTSLKFQCVTLQQCITFEDLPVFFQKLRFLGPHVASDTHLYVKITRVCSSFLRMYIEDCKPKSLQFVCSQLKTIIVECLLPGLSLMQYNCCVSEELWQLINLYSYDERYSMYALWKKSSLENTTCPLLMKAVAVVSSKTKYVLKRITKENIKEYGRQIGKLSHSSPAILFHHVLNQIQQFDNFIIPIVDSLKYLTSMTYDVLAFSIVESVMNNENDRLKYDDTNVSIWLQSLAVFCATVFKKYPIDLAGVLQYLVGTLTQQKAADELVLLRELVLKMAGIEINEHFTRDQLQSMSGGPLLLQGAYYNQNQNTKKASLRFRDCVLQYNLATPLMILIAQQRHSILFEKKQDADTDPYNEDKRPMKLIGHLFDLCHETLLQFMSFVHQNCTVKEVAKTMPDLLSLLTHYGLSIEVAFSLTREMFQFDIWEHYDKMLVTEAIILGENMVMTEDDKSKHFANAYADIMGPVVDMVERVYKNESWEGLSHEIFTIFWTLSLSDLEVPVEEYARQTRAITAQNKTIDDATDMSWNKKKKEKEKLVGQYEKLVMEQRKQEDHVVRILEYFESNGDNWFNTKSAKVGPILMQLMIFPRCAFTSMDSIYCAKFLLLLHRIKLPNFYSLICFDKIFIEIALPMSLCTENEAERYGRFLYTLLAEINRWHSDVNIYNRECLDHPGFNTCFKGGMRGSTSNTSTQLDYENYRHIVHKWHHSITKLFVSNLETSEYQLVKTSLIIMKQILPVYPIVEKLGMALKRRVTRVCENEKSNRPDLWALAMGYLGQMNSRVKQWINESEFHEDKSQKAQNIKKAKRDNSKTDLTKESTDNTIKKRKVEAPSTKDDKKFKSVNSPRDKARSSRSSSQNRKN